MHTVAAAAACSEPELWCAEQGPIRSTAVRELQFAASTSLPEAVNKAFSTLPTLVDARGFELNVSMAGDTQLYSWRAGMDWDMHGI